MPASPIIPDPSVLPEGEGLEALRAKGCARIRDRLHALGKPLTGSVSVLLTVEEAEALALLPVTPTCDAGWRPISTAPKDRTKLLLWSKGPTWEDWYIGYYEDGRGDEAIHHIGWHTDEGSDIDPSHWKPLDPPPSSKDSKPTTGQGEVGHG